MPPLRVKHGEDGEEQCHKRDGGNLWEKPLFIPLLALLPDSYPARKEATNKRDPEIDEDAFGNRLEVDVDDVHGQAQLGRQDF